MDQTSTAQSQTAHSTNTASTWTPATHLAQPVPAFQTSDAMASTISTTTISTRLPASQEPTSTCTCAPLVQMVPQALPQSHPLQQPSQAQLLLHQLQPQLLLLTSPQPQSLPSQMPAAPRSTAWRLYTLLQPSQPRSRRSSFQEKHHW